MTEDPPAIRFSDIIDSARALFLAALIGMPIGILTGICVGIWFFVVGGVYGAIAGIPTGFVAALFGGAIGRRWGWTLSGAVSGAVGGYLVLLALHLRPGGPDALLLFAMLFPAIGGALTGWIVSGQIENIRATPRFLAGALVRLLYGSPLYRLPVLARLGLAVVEVAPVVAVIVLLWNQPL